MDVFTGLILQIFVSVLARFGYGLFSGDEVLGTQKPLKQNLVT